MPANGENESRVHVAAVLIVISLNSSNSFLMRLFIFCGCLLVNFL
jgi:hypothetical protein